MSGRLLTPNPSIVAVDVIEDDYGAIGVLQSPPFPIRRVYYLFELAIGSERGSHAHRTLWQMMISISGAFDVRLEGPDNYQATFHLNSAREALILPPGYWRDITVTAERAIMLVLASAEFDEDDYIRDYDSFRSWCCSDGG